ncbi:DEAD/DEAH box helicase [Ammoniphilus sp. CFH 90114]|uniref:helicase-related protein n=1 Tax=Ammoniphilus sp. CFH 90114 TaxID=2493665 RepID=UPI0013E96B5D|nr:DEAD/DEAH box helicase [Ammoniphilus sp. CFH 90114]
MSLTQLAKKMEQVESKFLISAEGKVQSVQHALKREGALRVAIQSLSTWIAQVKKNSGSEHELYMQGQSLRERLKLKLKESSAVILESVNQQYQTNLTVEQVIENNDWYYYHYGIMKTLQQSGILNDLFQELLTDIIPPHPKDEYPLTRAHRRSFIIHAGSTNSGKTHQSLEELKKSPKGIYLSPLRLLALEVYERLNEEGVPCDLLTGEEMIHAAGAKHTSCTIEKASYDEVYDVAVIDEGQMIGDSQRGYAWTRALLGLRAREIHVCCAREAVPLIKQLLADCKDHVEVVQHERQTPLLFQDHPFRFPQDVMKGDAFIVFSRKQALQVASQLTQAQWSSSIIYGNLPPETRRKQVGLFLEGETQVIVSTDAIGMGMNLPIRRIVFLETEKFDGTQVRELLPQEIKQISGRAGRKGIYERGYVNSIRDKAKIKQKLEMQDQPLQAAFIAPHDTTILSLPFGSLSERLKAWTNYEIQVPYFQKADITETLELLDLASMYEQVLPLDVLYNAVTIPFNYQDKELLSQWFIYLDCLKINRINLPKPKKRGNHLSALETYYRAIGLYYSFSSNFGLPYDWRWIKKERRYTSEQIHELLKQQLQPAYV